MRQEPLGDFKKRLSLQERIDGIVLNKYSRLDRHQVVVIFHALRVLGVGEIPVSPCARNQVALDHSEEVAAGLVVAFQQVDEGDLLIGRKQISPIFQYIVRRELSVVDESEFKRYPGALLEVDHVLPVFQVFTKGFRGYIRDVGGIDFAVLEKVVGEPAGVIQGLEDERRHQDRIGPGERRLLPQDSGPLLRGGVEIEP